MESKNSSFSFVVAFKSLAFILCSIMFAHLMVNIWDKFNRKVTYSGVKYKYDSDQRKELPCLTLCPENGLKKKGSFYSQKEIDENSYNLTEIFDPWTLLSAYKVTS